MKHKKLLWAALALVVIGALVYVQYRSLGSISTEITKRNHGQPWSWKRDFFEVIAHCSKLYLIAGLAFIYVGYVLRAWRWQIFLSKVKRVALAPLIPPQYIGFTGMVLLGRPGELIRPYLIARRTGVDFTTQIAVLVLERIFDMGAFALIVALNIAFAPSLRNIPHYTAFRKGSYLLLLGVAVLASAMYLLYKHGPRVVAWCCSSVSRKVSEKLDSFSRGLHILSGTREVLAAGTVSIVTWLTIAGCYLMTVRAFGTAELNSLHLPQVLLLMFFSVAGGVIQLPGIGGGAQVATIGALSLVFNVPLGAAAAGGILIWLMTSVSVVVPGFAFAHSEHVSLRAVSRASEEEPEVTTQ
ncbi:MAG: lysylphosphatidylglycerol synthase transmembrane domain-containing protein [Acidobacteriaceae bacterium]